MSPYSHPRRTPAAEFAIASNPKTPALHDPAGVGAAEGEALRQDSQGRDHRDPAGLADRIVRVRTGHAGFSLSVPITTHGVTLDITVTQLFAVKGRLGQQVTFTSIGTPFSIPLEQRITDAAVGRL